MRSRLARRPSPRERRRNCEGAGRGLPVGRRHGSALATFKGHRAAAEPGLFARRQTPGDRSLDHTCDDLGRAAGGGARTAGSARHPQGASRRRLQRGVLARRACALPPPAAGTIGSSRSGTPSPGRSRRACVAICTRSPRWPYPQRAPAGLQQRRQDAEFSGTSPPQAANRLQGSRQRRDLARRGPRRRNDGERGSVGPLWSSSGICRVRTGTRDTRIPTKQDSTL